jgi:translocation and assembly module TamB
MTILLAGLFGYSRTDHARNLVLDQINARIPGTLSAGQMEILAGGALVRLADLQLQDLQGNICLAFDTLKAGNKAPVIGGQGSGDQRFSY